MRPARSSTTGGAGDGGAGSAGSCDESIVSSPSDATARSMREVGWRPPIKSTFKAAGRSALATITAQLVGMRDGGFITAHDFHLGRTIAEAMCGGDVEPGTDIDEDWVMRLERRAFTSLLTHPKTQERAMGMMQTGKPVRNFRVQLNIPKGAKPGDPVGGYFAGYSGTGLSFTRDDGEFTISRLTAGNLHRLTVIAEGYGVGEVDRVKAQQARRLAPADTLTIKLGLPHSLRVRVFGPLGKPRRS